MADEMYFSSDERALLRGKRRLKRTETCRPCLVTVDGSPETPIEGVVMDVTPYGMNIRMLDPLPNGTRVSIQMMRDDHFRDPLGEAKLAEVLRVETDAKGGFTDHGVRLVIETIAKPESRPKHIAERRPSPPREKPRMHSIDITVGGDQRRRGS